MLGLVVIGRNEGERLISCFQSLPTTFPIVYVDSGSTDQSVKVAHQFGVEVVQLDPQHPFTAARARSEGFDHLLSQYPDLEQVQFIDGDCELAPGWIETGLAPLQSDPTIAVVCGRRREKFPDQSLYNRLCDLEWDTPVGEAKACGGDAMMQVHAFQNVGGFNRDLIAGEEPELCYRLRQQGWRILRLEAEMTLHDARMHRFDQWWTRSLRSGYAYALGAALHRKGPEPYCIKQNRSIALWGLLIPLLTLTSLPPTRGVSTILLLGYGIMILKISLQQRQRGLSCSDAVLYATFCMLGKFPNVLGQIRFRWHEFRGHNSRIIEYK